jgi:fatty-acyl-CoA synthase
LKEISMSETVADALWYWSRAVPDQVAVEFVGDAVTYAELNTWADGVAASLVADGVAPGDRVAIVGSNSLEWALASLGAWRAGAIVAPFNQRMVERELLGLVGDCGPKVVYASAELMPRLKAVHTERPTFLLRELESAVGTVRDTQHPAFPRVDVDPADPAAIVYTSGTTGNPKGVIHTHRSIAGEFHEWHLVEPIETNGLRPLLMLPLFTLAGVLWGVARVVLHGGTLYLEPTLDPARAVELIPAKRISSITGPPILWESIANQPGFEAADLSSVTTAHVGGARVSADLILKWKAKGVSLRQIYGQTEIGGSATAMPPDEVAEHPEQCGFGGIFTRIRIVDPEGNDLPAGEQGEILMRGPGMMAGYWRNDEATAAALRDGWLWSGDIGVLDERGYLTYVDRMKDMIISGGLNIAPMEIEMVIGKMPQIAEVAVISVADAKFGETPAALVSAKEPITEAEIIAWCSEQLSDYKVPRYIVFMDGPLPRMASGKIAKRDLAKDYASIPDERERVR